MKATLRRPPEFRRMRGGASIAVVMLLIFILAAAATAGLGLSRSSVMDAAVGEEQIAALFLAESGLERASAALRAGGATTGAACAQAAGGPFALGRGTVSIDTVSNGCVNGSGCSNCVITAVGRIGSSTRKLRRTVNLGEDRGVYGTGTQVRMTLANGAQTTRSIALFSLATTRGGAKTTASCVTLNDVTCITAWNLSSSNGNQAVQSIGAAVEIAAGQTRDIVQSMNSTQKYAEVGTLIPGMAGSAIAPAIVGFYWDEDNNCGGQSRGTVCNSQSKDTGDVSNGASATATGACLNWSSANPKQTCANWCFADNQGNLANTLVFGFTGKSANLNDVYALNGVSFNDIPLGDGNGVNQALVRYPPVPWDVYSEIWVLQNPPYLSADTASSGANATAAAGAGNVGFSATSGSTAVSVSSIPSGAIGVGDSLVVSDNGSGCHAGDVLGTVAAVPGGGTTSTAPGTYTLSAPSPCNANTRTLTAKSNRMAVSAIAGGNYLSQGDRFTLGGSVYSITSVPCSGTPTCNQTGNYGISPAGQFASSANNVAANGYTVHVGGELPAAGTLLAVRRGSGKIPTGSQAALPSASEQTPGNPFFYLTDAAGTRQAALQRLSAAQVCGGTCAFFKHDPADTNSFTIAKTSDTRQWAAGFMCVSNAGKPLVVGSTKIKPSDWREIIE